MPSYLWFTILSSLVIITTSNPADLLMPPTITIFKDEQIIFSSSFNITKILVPADGSKYLLSESPEMPSILFTVSDPKLEGGSCIYVLEGFAAYEVLEGGRDSTADYSYDKTIYFGAKDGLYVYHPESLSAKKLGPFRDDIIQLQKANGTDTIYFLTSSHRLYIYEKNGTVKSRIQNVGCATEFVLDTSNNIYYIACGDKLPHIIKKDGNALSMAASVTEDIDDLKLLRPAFIMDNCVPFFGDGSLYILYANGTYEKKELILKERPSAFSVDAALYLAAALNGKIYEFNVMEMLIRSMFGVTDDGQRDVSRLIMPIIQTVREGIFELNDTNLGYMDQFRF